MVNRNSSAILGSKRGLIGTLGEKSELAYSYYVYVNKEDYDKAYTLINKNR